MRHKLFNFNNRIFKLIFYFFITLTLYYALTSSNLILGDNHITRIGTTFFTTIILLIMMAIGLILYAGDSVRNFLAFIFIDKRKITSSIVLGIAILIQISFILLVHSGIGFDVSGVHQGLTEPNDINIIGYFSVNPNNLGLLLFQHFFTTLFHNKSWLFLQFITLFLVDLSAFFNLSSIAIIDKNKLPIGMYLHAIWLMLFPAVLVPYTDTWAIQFVSIYIFCYCTMAYTDSNKTLKIISAIFFGINLSAAYFIKPSAIIPAIAIVIIELLHLLIAHKKQWLWTMLLSLILVGSTGTSYYMMNQAIKNQTIVRVNSFRAKPMIHFINMGLSGDGGYNAHDSFKMVTLINKQDRIDYSVKSIKHRLHKMGFSGYLAFLWRKHGHNTADGTFAWLQDGDFVPMKYSPQKHGFKGKIQNFVYLYGNNVGDFRFITQMWWCLWLAIIFFGWHDDRKIVQVMRLSLVGGFIFLLIFEGGRSRYLIQFLPAFLLLATLNFDSSVNEIKRLFDWTNNNSTYKPAHRKTEFQ